MWKPCYRRLLRRGTFLAGGAVLLQAVGCSTDLQLIFGQVTQAILSQFIGGLVSGSFNLT